jgi:hypothetical protein
MAEGEVTTVTEEGMGGGGAGVVGGGGEGMRGPFCRARTLTF